MIDFRKLVKAGVHFGHESSRWCPGMAPYIWGMKNKIHLIDVSKTAYQLEKAAQFLEQVTASGRQVLLVGTKKPAQSIILENAQRVQMPYVNHRWIGGTLNNYSQVRKSITKLLHYEDIIAKAAQFTHYTKKELNVFQKNIDRLNKSVGGIRTLAWPLGAIVLIDVTKEKSALKEAVSVGVPVVALVDTNSDPSLVDYVIPANDDAPRSIQVIVEYLADAIAKGSAAATTKAQEQEVEEVVEVEPTMALILQEDEEESASKRSKKVVEPSKQSRKTLKKVATQDVVTEEVAEEKSEEAPVTSTVDKVDKKK